MSAASKEADRLIAGTGAPDLFVNVSADGMAKVRHKQSGLVCTFVPGEQSNLLRVYDLEGARGEDVGCNANMGTIIVTHYATKYGPGYSAADSARDAVAAIRDRYADARPYDGPVLRIEPPAGVSDYENAALLVGPTAQQRYTHVLTAMIEDWIFKQRMTGSGQESAIVANQVMAGAMFNEVLTSAVKP